jgi:hypothetical protein
MSRLVGEGPPMATATGVDPPPIVVAIVFVAVSITCTPASKLLTYAHFPSGVMAIPTGGAPVRCGPKVIVEITVFWAVSNTETEFL